MLQTGEEIDADVGTDDGVPFSVGRSMNERASTTPIFVRSVGEEDFGNDFFRNGSIEKTAGFAGGWIGFGRISEREMSVGKKSEEVG